MLRGRSSATGWNRIRSKRYPPRYAGMQGEFHEVLSNRILGWSGGVSQGVSKECFGRACRPVSELESKLELELGLQCRLELDLIHSLVTRTKSGLQRALELDIESQA